ncbi:MAG: 1-phosphofructokinase family hexose kinase [Micrococcales bacterium]|nr:1-phosphofructokinase family hexose kinase [Micrococcales bacterium]
MIVTLTANPSFDRSVQLPGPLLRGEVQRATGPAVSEPGGKGVNVSRALVAAGFETVAVLPGDADDPMVVALHGRGIPTATTAIGTPIRQNVTLTEPDGTTTKLNEPGPGLDAGHRSALLALVAERSENARWLVLAGSLPPGVGADWYAELVAAARARAPHLWVAVDTSGAPLAAVVAAASAAGQHLDLITPNGAELAALLGRDDGAAIEADPALAAELASGLLHRGVGAVLLTLGAVGAVLATAGSARERGGAWFAAAPRITARSTVGAGDSALAGYLIAECSGADSAGRLAQAVAHGSAAAALPGSAVPALADTHPDAVTVHAL